MKPESKQRDISRLKVVVTGTRGIPAIQGGVETHCEELFPRLARYGMDIVLIRRSCYVSPDNRINEFKGVRLVDLYAPHLKSLEAIIHTLLSIIWAKRHRADLVHIHAIGPGIMTPFARLLGLKVVFTHHGPDYDRKKWGIFAKLILRIGEKFASKYANEVIVISRVIEDSILQKFGRASSHLIFNGVPVPKVSSTIDYITSIGLESRNYIFTLGRFVGEKGFDLLINAFVRLVNDDIKLVIAGDSDHETTYSRQLKDLALKNGVILTGFIRGEKLQQLFTHARVFVLPSFHEGLPISLLEAMSYELPVIVSDIPANKQIDIPLERFFTSGDEKSLFAKLNYELAVDFKPVKYDMSQYDWDRIAVQTASVYEQVF
ncbi:MAG TPA: glycosyltransferase family 4 protein [Desulfobacteraceae bacterium]|nr:glycosyltransferase family 4 protein [Desulfobacteraceae bacterium]